MAPQHRGERQRCQHWKRWQGGWGWGPGFGGFGSGWCSAGGAATHVLTCRRRLPACLQWSSKAFEVREPCTKIYNAARVMLSTIHGVKLEW